MLGLMSMMDLLETEENISEIVKEISKYILRHLKKITRHLILPLDS